MSLESHKQPTPAIFWILYKSGVNRFFIQSSHSLSVRLFIFNGFKIFGSLEQALEFYRLIIQKAQESYNVTDNEDYPEITIHSIPVPDFISDERQKQTALRMLVQRVQAIPQENYGFFAITCNTAHLLAPELKKQTSVPFVSMIDETIRSVTERKAAAVGLLASPITIKSELYEAPLKERGVKVIKPNAEELVHVEDAIRAVIANDTLDSHRAILHKVADTLRRSGAELIVLGCTELPLVYGDHEHEDVISSMDVLSDALLRKYYGVGLH